MKRTLFLSVLVAGVALALAAGSYAALAGSDPVTEVAGVVTGVDDPDDDPDADDVDDDDGDDGDGDDGDVEGAQNVADVIGSTFDDASQGDVLALHDAGFGFGAIFKLYLLAAANSTSVEALLDTIPTNADGKYQFAFGKLFKELTDEVTVFADGEDGMPKNLGKAVSDLKKDGTDATAATTDDGDEDDGQGPPEQAPAHGRNRD